MMTLNSNETTDNATTTTASPETFDNVFYATVYGGIIGGTCFFMFARSIFQFQYSIKSGINLHNKMFRSILDTSVRFFDVNPVGRVLNRFSKDLGLIDDLMPSTLM